MPNKNINKSNAQHAIVFEAVALALAIDAGTELLSAGVRLQRRIGSGIASSPSAHGCAACAMSHP